MDKVKQIIGIADATTGEYIERELTEAEIAADLENQKKAKIKQDEQLSAAATKAAAKAALLAKLGINEDEARLLLS